MSKVQSELQSKLQSELQSKLQSELQNKLQCGARRVLVTGGSSGIGQAVALELLRTGGKVMMVGRREESMVSIAEDYPERASFILRDLADGESREGLLEEARDWLGGLDGFVHSAGIAIHQPLGQIDDVALRSQLEINLVAPLRLGEQALEYLEVGGAMVFVTSTLALKPVPRSAVYSAAKAGLESLIRSFAIAGVARGLRVNGLCPGVVDTPMVRQLRMNAEESLSPGQRRKRGETQLDALRRLHPLGLGKAEEVARAIVQLLQAPWTTGSSLLMDGGLGLGLGPPPE